jgi:hypothetical protein
MMGKLRQEIIRINNMLRLPPIGATSGVRPSPVSTPRAALTIRLCTIYKHYIGLKEGRQASLETKWLAELFDHHRHPESSSPCQIISLVVVK